MKYDAQVAPDGTYTPPPASNQKASYATMVYVRGDDCGGCRLGARALRHHCGAHSLPPRVPNSSPKSRQAALQDTSPARGRWADR